MNKSRTTLKLTAVTLGVIALFGAAAMAGVNRVEEMRGSGITENVPATTAPQNTHRL